MVDIWPTTNKMRLSSAAQGIGAQPFSVATLKEWLHATFVEPKEPVRSSGGRDSALRDRLAIELADTIYSEAPSETPVFCIARRLWDTVDCILEERNRNEGDSD